MPAHRFGPFGVAHQRIRAPVNTPEEQSRVGLSRRLRHAAIQAQRQELIRIWQDNQISGDVLHHIEEDLDYQESHR